MEFCSGLACGNEKGYLADSVRVDTDNYCCFGVCVNNGGFLLVARFIFALVYPVFDQLEE